MTRAQLLPLAQNGDVEAQYKLAMKFFRGEGGPVDQAGAFDWVSQAAPRGHKESQFVLGAFYHNGEGVEKNMSEAVRWYRSAAAQGHAGAQFNLGCCYESGEGVPASMAEAVYWYHLSAEQADADAIEALKELGEWRGTHMVDARVLLEADAERGSMEAQFQLGVQMARSKSSPEDLKKGVEWLRKAAAQLHPGAQSALGALHEKGMGVPRDFAEAVRCYRLAADQGHATAQFNLGYCYEQGRGVARDVQTAIAWYRKAAEQGDPDAGQALRDLESASDAVQPVIEISATADEIERGSPDGVETVQGAMAPMEVSSDASQSGDLQLTAVEETVVEDQMNMETTSSKEAVLDTEADPQGDFVTAM